MRQIREKAKDALVDSALNQVKHLVVPAVAAALCDYEKAEDADGFTVALTVKAEENNGIMLVQTTATGGVSVKRTSKTDVASVDLGETLF